MKILILEGLWGCNKGKKKQWRLKHSHLEVGDMITLNCHDWKVIKVMEENKKMNILVKNPEDGENYKILISDEEKIKVGDKIPYLRLYLELPDIKSIEALDCEVVKIYDKKEIIK